MIGTFADRNVALISASVIADVAIDNFPKAKYVIEVGACCAFDLKQCKLGDVLVSETIRNYRNNQRRDVIHIVPFLKFLFCEDNSEDKSVGKKFRVCHNSHRVSEIHIGEYVSHFKQMNDKKARRKLQNDFSRAIGGDLQGGHCLQLRRKGNIEGIIMIKGVADYGDGSKHKEWEHTATVAALKYIQKKILQSQGE